MNDFLKRTWAEIDLDAIRHNFRTIEDSLSPGSRAMAVVKADAYGHGAGYVSRALQEAGASWFGVSNLDEAMQIRNAGIVEPILILAYTPPEEAARLAAFSVCLLYTSGTANRLKASRKLAICQAAPSGCPPAASSSR